MPRLRGGAALRGEPLAAVVCPWLQVHEVGAEVTEVYSAAGSGVCQPLTRRPPDTRSFRAGAAIPASSFVELKNLFEDAACTSPLGVEDVPTCASSPPSRHVLARTFTATTPYYRAYNTGPKHEGPSVERPFGGGTPSDCRPAQRARCRVLPAGSGSRGDHAGGRDVDAELTLAE